LPTGGVGRGGAPPPRPLTPPKKAEIVIPSEARNLLVLDCTVKGNFERSEESLGVRLYYER
jgi:hypothetical protein